jgi:hypothetical protein|tara:strand:- start:987 stop:1121 length:135 start_codon:yes stop_codon:yes gene_type:complete
MGNGKHKMTNEIIFIFYHKVLFFNDLRALPARRQKPPSAWGLMT